MLFGIEMDKNEAEWRETQGYPFFNKGLVGQSADSRACFTIIA